MKRKRIDKSQRVYFSPDINSKPECKNNTFNDLCLEFEMITGRKPVNNAEVYSFMETYKQIF